jgi:hypothetical protein
MVRREVPAELLAETGVNQGHPDEDQAQHHEGQDAERQLQMAEVVEEQLSHAKQKQAETREAQAPLLQREPRQ